MTEVSMYNFQNQAANSRKRQEQVAAGVGGAAGVGATTRAVGKWAIKNEAGSNILASMYTNAGKAINTVNDGKEVTTGLYAAFKANMAKYSKSVETLLMNLKNKPFIAPIIKSPVTHKLASCAGGAMAFFVLATGLTKAYREGGVAIEDIKSGRFSKAA